MKKENGVTLVALVVTIIVLIILAGISINLVLGDNGIITIAKKAKENTELAKTDEETQLNELYTQLETEGSNSGNLPYDSIAKLTEFKTAIANAIEEAGGVKTEISAKTSVFANNIKGILKEATKNATATSEDIAKGKTAYVNGILIEGNAKFDINVLNDYTEIYSVHLANPNSSYILNKQYSMILVVVTGIGAGSGGEIGSSNISIESNTKPVVSLLANDSMGYADRQYKSSASVMYLINPDIGTKINYSASYYGKVHIYALDNRLEN